MGTSAPVPKALRFTPQVFAAEPGAAEGSSSTPGRRGKGRGARMGAESQPIGVVFGGVV